MDGCGFFGISSIWVNLLKSATSLSDSGSALAGGIVVGNESRSTGAERLGVAEEGFGRNWVV